MIGSPRGLKESPCTAASPRFFTGGILRIFLNNILAFIGTTSLTDEEFDSIELEAAGWDQATYDVLSEVLVAREAVSSMQERLKYAFRARGIEVDPSAVSTNAKSNILIGGPL